MKPWRIGACVFVLLLLQSSLLPRLGLPLATPDLLLLLTIYTGLLSTSEKATVTGFMAGIAQDALSTGVPGISSFAKSMVGCLTPLIRRRFIVTHAALQIFAVLIFTSLHALILFALLQLFAASQAPDNLASYWHERMLPDLLTHLIFWVPLAAALRRVLPPIEEDLY